MGNFEKLVVLTVLFLSAVVLAVSLSSDDENPAESPLSAAKRNQGVASEDSGAEAAPEKPTLTAEGRRAPGRRAKEEAASAASGAEKIQGLAAGAGEPSAGVPANEQGHPRVLKTRQGLAESALPDYMVYTAAAGDTWTLLADRFYRSATYVPLLQSANEGLAAPSAGDALLVPVYDFRAAPKDRAPRSAAPARPAEPAVLTAASSAGAASGAATKPSGAAAGSYTVVDGDNLWKIAQKTYGSGARWNEIFEANKDVMRDADSLKVGMTLRIPKK
jgi:nucleoid-associated protein YgaU